MDRLDRVGDEDLVGEDERRLERERGAEGQPDDPVADRGRAKGHHGPGVEDGACALPKHHAQEQHARQPMGRAVDPRNLQREPVVRGREGATAGKKESAFRPSATLAKKASANQGSQKSRTPPFQMRESDQGIMKRHGGRPLGTTKIKDSKRRRSELWRDAGGGRSAARPVTRAVWRRKAESRWLTSTARNGRPPATAPHRTNWRRPDRSR